MNDFPVMLSLLSVFPLKGQKLEIQRSDRSEHKSNSPSPMQNQIHNALQYLFSHSSGPLDLLLFPKKSIPVSTVTVWGGGCCRTCHLQNDSCSKHMSTLKYCNWKQVGCSHSFPFGQAPLQLQKRGWVSIREGLPFAAELDLELKLQLELELKLKLPPLP